MYNISTDPVFSLFLWQKWQ